MQQFDTRELTGTGWLVTAADWQNLETVMAVKLARIADIVDKGASFNTSTLDDVTDNAKMLNCTQALTITLETYTDKPEGFQFGGMAAGGIVTFVGTYERISTYD